MPQRDRSWRCRDCMQPPEPGKTRCAACAVKSAERERARRAARKDRGRCLACEARALPGKSYCAAHREYYRQRAEAAAAEAKQVAAAEEERWLARVRAGEVPPERVPKAVAARLWVREAQPKPKARAKRKPRQAPPPAQRRPTIPPPHAAR